MAGLSIQVEHILLRDDILPRPEVVSRLRYIEVLTIPEIGRKRVEEIGRWLADHGLTFADCQP
jgi:hypothetical protein